jgi:hypothetical protein
MLIEKIKVTTNIYVSSFETEYPTEYLQTFDVDKYLTNAMKQSYSEGN